MAITKSLVAKGLLLGLFMAPSSAALWALGTAPRQTAPDTPQTRLLLVVPTRYTIIQLAFDIQRLRNIDLIAYDDQAPADSPTIHVWNPQAHDWIHIDSARIRSGTLFSVAPDTAVVVGRDEDLTPGLLQAVGTQVRYRRVPELNLATILNTLHEELSFNAQEWKWLANRYGIKLQDLNAERRRYGRFGKPDRSSNPEPASKDSEPREVETLPPRVEVAPPSTPHPKPAMSTIEAPKVSEPDKRTPLPAITEPAHDTQPTALPRGDISKDIPPEDK